MKHALPLLAVTVSMMVMLISMVVLNVIAHFVMDESNSLAEVSGAILRE